LTFDDYGTPDQVDRVLTVMAEHQVRAMFFLVGQWAAENAALVDRIAAAGHVLGNHTHSHRDLLALRRDEREQELAHGVPGALLRPPMGRYDRSVRRLAREHGMRIACWGVDSDDGQGVSEDYIYSKVVREARPGSIVRFHLHADNTVAVLPRVIDGLRRKNLTLASAETPLSGTEPSASHRAAAADLVATVRRLLQRFAANDLSRNAAFLMASTGIMSVLGFLFWVFAAHLYSSSDIGIASAVVSISVLISSMSMLGLNVGLIRFLPDSETPSGDINAALIVVGGCTMLVSAGYVLAGTALSSKLPFFTENLTNGLLFCLLLAMVALNSLTDSVFIARRRAHFHTIAYTVFGAVRLVLALTLVRSGALGIFLAYTAAGAAALLLSFFYMERYCGYHFLTRPNFRVLSRTRQFTTDNYFAALLTQLPSKLVPTLIVAQLGGTSSAYFAMAMTIANLLYIVPTALEQSLLAEGANDSSRQVRDSIHAAKLLFSLLIPMILVTIVAAPHLLRVFGADYSRGSSTILQLLAVSAVFLGVTALCTSMLNIQQRSRWNTVIQALTAAVTLTIAYVLLPTGLNGVGLAFLIGSAVGAFAHIAVQFVYLRGARHGVPPAARGTSTVGSEVTAP
jgi:O-antigen/teichoic acid export membrane protein